MEWVGGGGLTISFDGPELTSVLPTSLFSQSVRASEAVFEPLVLRRPGTTRGMAAGWLVGEVGSEKGGGSGASQMGLGFGGGFGVCR